MGGGGSPQPARPEAGLATAQRGTGSAKQLEPRPDYGPQISRPPARTQGPSALDLSPYEREGLGGGKKAQGTLGREEAPGTGRSAEEVPRAPASPLPLPALLPNCHPLPPHHHQPASKAHPAHAPADVGSRGPADVGGGLGREREGKLGGLAAGVARPSPGPTQPASLGSTFPLC